MTRIVALLRQYTVQQRQMVGDISPLAVEDLAQVIHECTGGFPGLVGLSCSEVLSKVKCARIYMQGRASDALHQPWTIIELI